MSLRLKTILGVSLIEAVLLAILITSVLNYMQLANEESLENHIATTTTLFATTTKDAVLSYDLASLETFVEEILKNKDVLYVRIFSSDNNLLASGGDDQLVNMPFLIDQHYHDVTDSVYDTESLITVDGIIYGRIEIGISTAKTEQSITETRQLAAAIALIEMFLVALFSFFLGIYLTKQLKVLRNSARKIAEGDLNHKIEVKAKDEIGEVAHSFNKMINSLNQANQQSTAYHQEILELNKSLEDRVARRTQKIEEQKDKLESAYKELKLTQKQLVQSEKMASIGQLAAGVAHEINNPVAFVKSNLSSLDNYIKTYQEVIDQHQKILDNLNHDIKSTLKNEIDLLEHYAEENDLDFINEDIVTLVKESINGTDRIEEIVKGLKIYSRASDDLIEECDINECLQDTIKMLNNELKYSCDVVTQWDTLPICHCNRSKITQVFTNLIINATHAMEEKGTLTISTALSQLSDKPAVLIKISDTGKGIPPENLSKLFDPFFTTKPVGQGTGLGLSISHGIIEDHSGAINVESEVGKGTCFNILLPTGN